MNKSASVRLRATDHEVPAAGQFSLQDDVWEAVAQGRLPPGVKNRFMLLTKFSASLPPKENPAEPDPWQVRPKDVWQEREVLQSDQSDKSPNTYPTPE